MLAIPIFLTVEVAKTVNCKDACKHSFAKTVFVQSSHINNTHKAFAIISQGEINQLDHKMELTNISAN